jgi:hypothetical protein
MPKLYYGNILTYSELISYIENHIIYDQFHLCDDDDEITTKNNEKALDWFNENILIGDIFKNAKVGNLPDEYKECVIQIDNFLSNNTYMKCVPIDNFSSDEKKYLVGVITCECVYGQGVMNVSANSYEIANLKNKLDCDEYDLMYYLYE